MTAKETEKMRKALDAAITVIDDTEHFINRMFQIISTLKEDAATTGTDRTKEIELAKDILGAFTFIGEHARDTKRALLDVTKK